MKYFFTRIYLVLLTLIKKGTKKNIKIPDNLVKKVLFIIPEDKYLISILKNQLEEFATKTQKEVFIFVEENLTPAYCETKKYKIISYSSKRKNFLGLPIQNTINELKMENFEIIIDLNLYYSVYIDYILINFEDKILVGIKKGDHIDFDIEFKINHLKNFVYIYQDIFNYLSLI